jgi:hypothetical protein
MNTAAVYQRNHRDKKRTAQSVSSDDQRSMGNVVEKGLAAENIRKCLEMVINSEMFTANEKEEAKNEILKAAFPHLYNNRDRTSSIVQQDDLDDIVSDSDFD